MSDPVQSPVVYYGISVLTAAVLAFLALTSVEGTGRWALLALAVLELVTAPYLLKRASE